MFITLLILFFPSASISKIQFLTHDIFRVSEFYYFLTMWIILIRFFKLLPGQYSLTVTLIFDSWWLSVFAFACAVFQTQTTSSQWLLSELFYDQVSVSCTTNFSILTISTSPSLTPSSRESQDGPTTAGTAQDKTCFSWTRFGEVFIYNNFYHQQNLVLFLT